MITEWFKYIIVSSKSLLLAYNFLETLKELCIYKVRTNN